MCYRCIVVVDDDQAIHDAFEALLGDEYCLHFEKNGIDATKAIEEMQPDLLFLDIKMPGMNGIEVLQWVKWRNIETKIFLLTAMPQPIYQKIANDYGVGFIKKPFNLEDIESITSDLLH
jgi:CheY-like chemotaxis protein